MKKKYLLGALVIIVLICSIYFLKTNDNQYYNPANEEKFINIENIEHPEFSYLLETYLKLETSGLMVSFDRTENTENYQSLGNGNYEMYATMQDVSQPEELYTRSPNIIFTIEKNLLKFDELEEGVLSRDFNEFVIPELTIPTNIHQSESYQTLQKMDYDVDVSISFADYVSFEDITAFMKNCDNTQFVWLAIDSVDRGNMHPLGLSLLKETYTTPFTEEANQAYPNLSLVDEEIYDAQKLKQSYISKLKLLKDHPNFLELMPDAVMPNDIQPDIIDELYNDALNNNSCYGIRLITNSKNVLSLIDKFDVSQIYIHEN